VVQKMKLGIKAAQTALVSLLGPLAGCTSMPATVADDPSLAYVELGGYKFHVRTFGDETSPPVIVVHGGPGADSTYLTTLRDLAQSHYVILYDQRGTGLSARVDQSELTLERSLADLGLFVEHFGNAGPVRLIGHSWGGMLVIGYLSRHPERVSHAVVVEPGILNPRTAKEFVERLKKTRTLWDAIPLIGHIIYSPLVSSKDGHERSDYVMTGLMNRSRPGGPYQCPGQAMPPAAFTRAGYAAFHTMLKPVLDNPASFKADLTAGIEHYQGRLLMLSSACSFIGYDYQQQFHLPHLPSGTVHLRADSMGHNMLTLNPQWSVKVISGFFAEEAGQLR
jgi:proline iminopeptidase